MPFDPPPVSDRHVVRGACPHDCPDTCALLTTVENGRAIAIRGAPDHPATGGVLCTKVARYLDRTYSDQRVLHPQRRVGRNANAVTSQALTDLGRAATFYDCPVEVARA